VLSLLKRLATVLALASLALPPAGASAAQMGSPRARAARWRGACSVTLKLAPGPLVTGEAAALAGALSCPLSEQAGGQSVTIEQHTAGTPGFETAGTVVTEASGAFQFTTATTLSADASFRALVPALAARSVRVAVKLLPAVSLAGLPASAGLPGAGASTASARAARTATFSGTVGPTNGPARVVLQRETASGESWRRIGIAEVGPEGRYAITHSFVLAGPATVRVVVHARGLRAAASEALTYEVPPRQNPRLTLAAPSSSLTYGQPLAIAGVSAAGEGTELTLLALTRGGAPVAVASTSAGAGGHYQFAAQTPTQNTIYRVTGGHARSAALRAGVQPLLSVQGPQAAVQAGEAVRVCGTVTPATPGQIVLLQRENPGGLGFHTVAETTLGSGSAYCLEHVPFSAGSETYRVRVPRSAELRAVASAPAQVTVTAASAAALAPLTGEGETAPAPRETPAQETSAETPRLRGRRPLRRRPGVS
jgi:hypothetical protein